jgi:RNA polymerase sigma factor (sigma-70 family)
MATQAETSNRQTTEYRVRRVRGRRPGRPNVSRRRLAETHASAEPAMPVPEAPTDYEQLFLNHMRTVTGIVTFIARRRGLTADESDEFGSHVNLKLIEDDYAVFRKFRGRSSLRTYLTVVIQRLFLDWRVAQWGKWRPSALAKRSGKIATLFEQLTMRRGLSFEQALTVLETEHRIAVDRSELEALFAQLPARPRRRYVGEDALQDVPASYGNPIGGLLAEATASVAAQTAAALSAELSQLPAEDQLLLKSRFLNGNSVIDIAKESCQDAKKLYRRLERLLARLRAKLEMQGIRYSQVQDLLADGDAELTAAWE